MLKHYYVELGNIKISLNVHMFYAWYNPTVDKYFGANTACLPLQYNTASTNINSYFTS